MEDPWSSSSKAKDEEFEEVWSELHSLKKLYGILLQKTRVDNSPNGDHAHDSDSTLDEKSRRLLKKLLDGAIHQALQSQTKIVFSNPGSTPASGSGLRKETVTADKLPECHPADVHHDLPKSTSPVVDTTPNQPETMKPVRLSVASALPAKLDMERQTSIKSTRSSHEKLHRNRYSRIDHEHDHDRLSSKLRSTKVVYDTPSDTHPSEPKISPGDGLHKETIPPKKLQDCHPAVVHHDKPKATKPERLPVAKQQITQNASSTTGKLDMKRQASMKSKLRSTRDHRIKVSPDLTVNTRTRQTCSGDLLAVVPVPAQKRARVDAKDTGQTCINGRVDRQLTHSKRSKIRAKLERGKSRMDHEGHRGRTSKTKKSSNREASSCAKCTKHVHKSSSYGSVSRAWSSSRTCYSSSSSSSEKPTSRRMPARPGSRHREVGQPRRKVEQDNKEEGRLKRFKNKLALIFHHHHHHHHHIIDSANSIVQGGSDDHRSPWKYLRGILRQKGGEEGRKQAKAAVARVPARQWQHGYFHALLEGLVRHLWGMRRRKKKVQPRLGAKKLHWWQRFRRRGGARPANRKRPRLRLGFSSRINPQNPKR